MKALSLSQPWADIVASGLKTIENRKQQHGFRTPFPQRVLIHAAKSYDGTAPLRIHRACKALLVPTPRFLTTQPAGAIIGVCDFIDAGTPKDVSAKYPAQDAVWVDPDAEWCYVVRRARAFRTPVPYRGQLGFFEVPDDLVPEAFECGGCGLSQGCACGGPTH